MIVPAIQDVEEGKNDEKTNNEPESAETKDNWVNAYGTEGSFTGLNKSDKIIEKLD